MKMTDNSLRIKISLIVFIICIITLSISLSCGGGYSRGCNCDSQDSDSSSKGGDDDTDDDQADDDDVIDDDDDDDDIQEQAFPPGLTPNPANGVENVSLISKIWIESDSPLDSANFTFELVKMTEKEEAVSGFEQFSYDLMTFYFYSYNLLEEGTTYKIRVTIGDNIYAGTFTTTGDAGLISISGNSDIDAAKQYTFLFEPVTINEPSIFEDLIILTISGINLVMGPAILDSSDGKFGEIIIGGGEAIDMIGDETLEHNFSSVGYHVSGQINGNYIKTAGMLQLDIRGTLVPIEFLEISGVTESGSNEKSAITTHVTGVIRDCEAVAEAVPFIGWLVEAICDANIGIFVDIEGNGALIPIEPVQLLEPTFDSTGIEVAANDSLYCNDMDYINTLNAGFFIYKNDELIISSDDFNDRITFPDCCTEEIAGQTYSFTTVRFDFPEAFSLDPDTYQAKVVVGGHGTVTTFTAK